MKLGNLWRTAVNKVKNAFTKSKAKVSNVIAQGKLPPKEHSDDDGPVSRGTRCTNFVRPTPTQRRRKRQQQRESRRRNRAA